MRTHVLIRCLHFPTDVWSRISLNSKRWTSSRRLAINTHAKKLFDCGHVQNIEIGTITTHLWIRADCLSEMKKDIVYKILMLLPNKSYIDMTECGCKAGKEPKASS